jgi:hypothetical protein
MRGMCFGAAVPLGYALTGPTDWGRVLARESAG